MSTKTASAGTVTSSPAALSVTSSPTETSSVESRRSSFLRRRERLDLGDVARLAAREPLAAVTHGHVGVRLRRERGRGLHRHVAEADDDRRAGPRASARRRGGRRPSTRRPRAISMGSVRGLPRRPMATMTRLARSALSCPACSTRTTNSPSPSRATSATRWPSRIASACFRTTRVHCARSSSFVHSLIHSSPSHGTCSGWS